MKKQPKRNVSIRYSDSETDELIAGAKKHKLYKLINKKLIPNINAYVRMKTLNLT